MLVITGAGSGFGLELARKVWHNLICTRGYTWDMPNIMRGDADTAIITVSTSLGQIKEGKIRVSFKVAEAGKLFEGLLRVRDPAVVLPHDLPDAILKGLCPPVVAQAGPRREHVVERGARERLLDGDSRAEALRVRGGHVVRVARLADAAQRDVALPNALTSQVGDVLGGEVTVYITERRFAAQIA